jgi:NACalpha-BTF3-like transcription factor
MNLQESQENFNQYKKSIHDIKSKKFYERYEQTECEITDEDSTFILEESNISNEELNTIKEESDNEICLID